MIKDILYYNYHINIKDKKILKTIQNFKYNNKLSSIENIKQLSFKIKEQLINNASYYLDKINIEKLTILNDTKKLTHHNIHKWNKYKMYSNDYELIYNSKSNIKSLALKEPVSRSYFKMIEIINDIPTIKSMVTQTDKLRTFHIAESPGGFIEAFIDIRHNNLTSKTNMVSNGDCDLHYTISLMNELNIPTWTSPLTKKMLSDYSNYIKILTGIHGDGNILNIDNIDYVLQRFKNNKLDIITADGGFNLDNQYLQEYMSSILIFAELVLAIGCLKDGGHYILKIYDIHYSITNQIIILCHYLFNDCVIIKPRTSRPGNSEKYVICSSFKGISEKDFGIYYDSLKKWIVSNNKIDDVIIKLIRLLYLKEKILDRDFEINIVNKFQLSNCLNNCDEISKTIDDINSYYNDNQIAIIKYTLFSLPILSNSELENISKKQYLIAKEWCQNYNIKY